MKTETETKNGNGNGNVTTTLAPAEFRSVAVDRIAASKTNPRKTFSSEGLEELKASILQVGIQMPLIIRPKMVVGASGKNATMEYELVAGERRWRAAKLAGLGQVPCLVRELTDEQVLEIQLIENLQREDVSALEEAEGFRRLIDSGKYTAESLAEKLGKSRSHVFARLRLCKASKEVKQMLAEGNLDASKAGLLTMLPPAVQKQFFNEWNVEEASFRQLKEEIERHWIRNLSGAPWKWDDAELVEKAGPCTTCPKRGANMDAESGPNVCTDIECFAAKRAAFGARQLAEAKAGGKQVISRQEWDDYKVRAKYVELDRTAYDLGEYEKTYREKLKGKEFEPVLAQTPEGVIEVLSREKLWELNPRVKQERESRATSDWEKKAREEQARKRQLRLALDKAVREAAPAIAAKARDAKEDLKFWRMAAICAATHFRDDSKQGGLGYAEEWLVENWKVGKGQYGGLAKGTLIKRVLGLKTVEECREAAVVLLALNVFTSFYQPGAEENFKAACEWAGFDLDGRLKELLAEKKKGKAAPEAKLKITRSKDPKKFGLNEHGACTKPNRYDVIFPKKTKCHATVLTALVGKNWQAASDAGVHGQGDNDWNMSGLPGDRPGGFKTEAEAVIAEFESLRNEYVNVGKRGHAESEYGGQMLTALCKRLPELLNAKGVGAPAKATGGAATKKKKAGKKK